MHRNFAASAADIESGTAGGGSAGGGFSSPALGSNTGSDMKIGITDLSGGIKIGSDGDIIGGMLGEGLGIKSSGDALQSIIAQSSTGGVLSSRSLEASSSSIKSQGEGSSIKTGMSGDQAMALYNQMKNGASQGEISGASQGEISGGSQGKSSSITSSQFPSLPGQLGARSSSSTPVTQQPQVNISQQVEKIVKAQAKSMSSSGGSSPIDDLGELGDFMAKGIDPLAKGISGAVDDLLGIGSPQSQRSQSLREAPPSSSESSSPRNEASQIAESSSSPLAVRDQVRNAISNSALFQSPKAQDILPSGSESKDSISQALQNPAPKDDMMQKPLIRDAWGEADESLPAPESNNQDDVAQVAPPSSKQALQWAKSRSRNKKPEQEIQEEDEMEVEEFEEFDEDDG